MIDSVAWFDVIFRTVKHCLPDTPATHNLDPPLFMLTTESTSSERSHFQIRTFSVAHNYGAGRPAPSSMMRREGGQYVRHWLINCPVRQLSTGWSNDNVTRVGRSREADESTDVSVAAGYAEIDASALATGGYYQRLARRQLNGSTFSFGVLNLFGLTHPPHHQTDVSQLTMQRSLTLSSAPPPEAASRVA